MPDISKFLTAIKSAIYGEEVRGSIHDALEIINDVADDAKKSASDARDSAATSASESKKSSESAAKSASDASASAKNASDDASLARSYASEAANSASGILQRAFVTGLISNSTIYDFNDGFSKFSAIHKCTASTVRDTKNSGYYQHIESTSGNIGTSENCRAVFDMSEIMTDAIDTVVEFDINMVTNGRWHISLCDLDVREALDELRYATDGVAVDIASSYNYQYNVNGNAAVKQSFFNTWVHCKFVIDFTSKIVSYTLTNKSNTSDTLTGETTFRDTSCDRITGIELYTWVQSDVVYIDNIDVTVSTSIDLTALGNTMTPEMHRMIFGGRNLGSSVSEEQIAAVRDGSFRGLLLGDYWEIDGEKWRIVDMDYWYDKKISTHHLVIMPDIGSSDGPMNADATTDGGYVGSVMYTKTLPQVETRIKGIFGDMILTHKEWLVNAVTDGKTSGVKLADSVVELPSEIMICGTNIHSSEVDTINISNSVSSKTQLALFNVAPKFIYIMDYWLRDVVNFESFACVYEGDMAYDWAYYDHRVRPVFAIG